jgi:carbonic anhydrase/acetyltransferase-like protein (isoleucine patch superfamily)
VNDIKIGSMTSVGDRAMIHESSGYPVGPLPTIVGNNVTVGM